MEKNSKDNKISARKKGVVVSDKSNKTVVVAVESFKTHSKYLKKIKSTKKYKVHDEENKYKIGDVVEIVPMRPMSKDKYYKIA
ncbi:MAG: 30S ribosomal protein S17 [Candidatus Moranbacteria bacterium RIFOXYA12_FULL_44_15]|nr:MAG: 30S ribosomal protein S17 [Candidatus Moranbacteria bacterium RIFOXYA12_FULL_44_15]OGI34238.1 MAG: 30S ribosomal protein S17 [Candidatus Moranbacteria bacterium RIFOXYA2_FULL_43_15]